MTAASVEDLYPRHRFVAVMAGSAGCPIRPLGDQLFGRYSDRNGRRAGLALGIGLAHSVAAAVFGGTADYVAPPCRQWAHEGIFHWYVAVAAGTVFLTALLMPEPSPEGRL